MILPTMIVFSLLIGFTVANKPVEVPKIIDKLEAYENNTIKISGFISNRDTPGTTNILKKTKELDKLVKSGVREITIEINSVGGLVGDGNKFIKTMLVAQEFFGVKFNCIVTGKAFSMAMVMFSACENRYATINAKLMWHSIRFMHVDFITEQSSKEIFERLHQDNVELWERTKSFMDDDFFQKHFDAETYHYSYDLINQTNNFFTIVREYEVK